MRLQKPAEYWQSLEKKYKRGGSIWVGITALAVIVFAAAVAWLVYQPPSLFSETKPSLGGIKGAILIAAVVSMIVYLINVFVKLAISSYHLSRDAAERLQLTHVFLALIKDAVIEPKDREIILSSLFSRADTGLLKGESGPTMPTPLGPALEAIKGK